MAGWACAAALALVAIGLHRRLGVRMELVARAAHELRGPLTAAGLALDGAERDSRMLGAVELELRRVALALGDLDAARGGRGSGDRFELVDLGRLCRTQMHAWRPVARAAGVELRCTAIGGVAVIGDPGRLAQATGNLLANALEHGRGDVELRICERGGRARIEVSDGGPGLAAAPAPGRGRGRGARGRGLAIVSSIAERHGGRLAAAPTARGTTVAIELPPAPAGALRTAAG